MSAASGLAVNDTLLEAIDAFAPAAHEQLVKKSKPASDQKGAEKDVPDRPPKKQRVVTDKAEKCNAAKEHEAKPVSEVVDILPPRSYLRQFKEEDWQNLQVTVICDVDAGTPTRCHGIVKDNLRPEGSSVDGGFDLPDEEEELKRCLVVQGRVEIYCEDKWYPATVLGVSMPSEDNEEEEADQAAEVEKAVHKPEKNRPKTSAHDPKKAAMKRRHEHMMAGYCSHLDALKARFEDSYERFETALSAGGKEICFKQPERVVSATGYLGVCPNRNGVGFGHRINGGARITTSLLTGEIMKTPEEAAEQLAIITACGELWQKQMLNGEHRVMNQPSNVEAQLPTSPTPATSPVDEPSVPVESAMEVDDANDEELGVQGEDAASSSSDSSSSDSSSSDSSSTSSSASCE